MGDPDARTVEKLSKFTDDDLWAEVVARGLVTQIGFVNPKIHGQYEHGSFILFERTWQDRWPVFGLRGGDTVTVSSEGRVERHVVLTLEIANELRVYAEALSVAEDWRPESRGFQVLKQVQSALKDALQNRKEPNDVG